MTIVHLPHVSYISIGFCTYEEVVQVVAHIFLKTAKDFKKSAMVLHNWE